MYPTTTVDLLEGTISSGKAKSNIQILAFVLASHYTINIVNIGHSSLQCLVIMGSFIISYFLCQYQTIEMSSLTCLRLKATRHKQKVQSETLLAC